MIGQLRAMARDNPLTARRIQYLKFIEESTPTAVRDSSQCFLRRSLTAASANLAAYSDPRFARAAAEGTLAEFPLISKKQLLETPEHYYPRLGIRRLVTSIGKTSGTTGTPLTIYRSLNSVIWEYAFVHHHWAWSGFQRGMPRATLRGDLVAKANQAAGPFWYHNRWENQLLLSSRHLHAPFVDQIVEKLASFRPYLMQAYPSTAYELAKHLQAAGRVLPIPFVYTGSEMLYSHQRTLIEEAFACKVMDFYGMAERVAFAAQCEHGSYHVHPAYSRVEIVDDAGNPTDAEGFVVGTTFHNLTMPLVRYQLSDRSRWKHGECACGRHFPMIEPISGKFEDVIHGSSGNAISPSIVTFAFKGLRFIESSQVAEIAPGKWQIRIVPQAGFGIQEREQLLANVRSLIDPELDVEIVECDAISRTSAYKYRWIVNESASKQI